MVRQVLEACLMGLMIVGSLSIAMALGQWLHSIY